MLSSRNLRERPLEPKKALACVTRTKLNEAQCEKTDPKREEAGAWWNGVVGIALRGRKKPNRHRARCEGRPPRRCNPAHLVWELTTSQPVARGRTAARERPDSAGKRRRLGQGGQRAAARGVGRVDLGSAQGYGEKSRRGNANYTTWCEKTRRARQTRNLYGDKDSE